MMPLSALSDYRIHLGNSGGAKMLTVISQSTMRIGHARMYSESARSHVPSKLRSSRIDALDRFRWRKSMRVAVVDLLPMYSRTAWRFGYFHTDLSC